MACAPGLLFPVLPLELSGGGLKEETRRQVASGGGFETFC
jgi:hypothetical protein